MEFIFMTWTQCIRLKEVFKIAVKTKNMTVKLQKQNGIVTVVLKLVLSDTACWWTLRKHWSEKRPISIVIPSHPLPQGWAKKSCISFRSASLYIFSCGGLESNKEDFSVSDLLLTWLCIFSYICSVSVVRMIYKKIRLKIHVEESNKANSKNDKKALNRLYQLLPSWILLRTHAVWNAWGFGNMTPLKWHRNPVWRL